MPSIPREEMTRKIDHLVAGTTPQVFHTALVKAYARGHKGVGCISYAALKSEVYVASRAGDSSRAGRIEEFWTAVALAEATAVGLCDATSTGEELQLAVRVADYLLTRNLPVSRILGTQGDRILGCHIGGKTPWVSTEVLFKAYAVCADGSRPLMPETAEEAQAVVDAGYRMVQPQLGHAIAKHLQDGTDASWRSMESAHSRAVAEWEATGEYRQAIAESMVNTVLASFVKAARAIPSLEIPEVATVWELASAFAPETAVTVNKLAQILPGFRGEEVV